MIPAGRPGLRKRSGTLRLTPLLKPFARLFDVASPRSASRNFGTPWLSRPPAGLKLLIRLVDEFVLDPFRPEAGFAKA